MEQKGQQKYPELRVLLLGVVKLLDCKSNEVSLSPRETLIIASLATNIGSPIPFSQLSRMVWGSLSPDSAVNSIQVSVHSIRKKLSKLKMPAVIITRRSGYELSSEHVTSDFEIMNAYLHLANQARDEQRYIAETEALRRGLEQWRGLPLSDFPRELMSDIKLKIIDRYIEILVRWTDCMFELGRSDSTIPVLRQATYDFPWAEGVQARLMAAMHNCGRTVDALDLYATLRATLVKNFGTEPSATVQSIHQRILRDESQIKVS